MPALRLYSANGLQQRKYGYIYDHWHRLPNHLFPEPLQPPPKFSREIIRALELLVKQDLGYDDFLQKIQAITSERHAANEHETNPHWKSRVPHVCLNDLNKMLEQVKASADDERDAQDSSSAESEPSQTSAASTRRRKRSSFSTSSTRSQEIEIARSAPAHNLSQLSGDESVLGPELSTMDGMTGLLDGMDNVISTEQAGYDEKDFAMSSPPDKARETLIEIESGANHACKRIKTSPRPASETAQSSIDENSEHGHISEHGNDSAGSETSNGATDVEAETTSRETVSCEPPAEVTIEMDVTSPPDENSKCGATQEAADETELECLGTSGGQIMAISAGEDTHVTPEIEGSQTPPSNVDGAIQSLQPQKYLSSTAIEQVLSFCAIDGVRIYDPAYLANRSKSWSKITVKDDNLLLFPLHHNRPNYKHWTLAIVDLTTATVRHYDSAPSERNEEEARSRLSAFKGILDVEGAGHEGCDWKFESVPYNQTNGFDCGVWTILFAMHSVVNLTCPEKIDTEMWRLTFINLIKPSNFQGSTLDESLHWPSIPSKGKSLCAPSAASIAYDLTGSKATISDFWPDQRQGGAVLKQGATFLKNAQVALKTLEAEHTSAKQRLSHTNAIADVLTSLVSQSSQTLTRLREEQRQLRTVLATTEKFQADCPASAVKTTIQTALAIYGRGLVALEKGEKAAERRRSVCARVGESIDRWRKERLMAYIADLVGIRREVREEVVALAESARGMIEEIVRIRGGIGK